jgi:hypothetical protein
MMRFQAKIEKSWEEIETAPRDGSVIIVYEDKPKAYGPSVFTAKWSAHRNSWVATDDVDTDPYDILPTHWRHI